MKASVQFLLFLVIGFVAVVIGMRIFAGGVAPTPEVLTQPTTLDDALARSAETGTPVFAVVTADWCGPCQMLKRGALADERVASWIESNTIPVSVDADRDRDAAMKLGAQGIPASYIIVDGEIAATTVGNESAESYLKFLNDALPAD